MIKNGSNIPSLNTFKSSKKNVLKGDSVHKSTPKKVVIKELTSEYKDTALKNIAVEPILENGRIVGVIHKCSCGEATEIRFKFEEPSSATEELKNDE